MPGAAFFDLDRTVLTSASGPVFSGALKAAGVIDRELPAALGRLLYGVYNTFGETLPSMVMARQAAAVAKGWRRDAVLQAARAATPQLLQLVDAAVVATIDGHRAAGRPVVLATTSPHDLVKPLADLLGFDDVVATRFRVDADERYDGTLAGPFVWGIGKLRAVKAWAAARGISLTDSYAYSDSVYDVPLLAAVGHPTIVNPDPRLRVIGRLRGWPTLHPVAAGVPRILGLEPQRLATLFARPEFIRYARFDFGGVEHIPRRGPAILVANHRSYFDAATIGLLIAKAGRTVRFLGKKEVFDAPVIGQIAKAMGGIRVDRGTGSDEPLRQAVEALEAGDLVALMPQGTIPRGPAFFDPELKGRWGAARLAAMARVPVIPVGLWGTEKVWPRSELVPNMLNLLDPPLVTVRVGPPVTLGYDDLDADTRTIMRAIVELLPPEAKVRREPTPDELRKTYPRGYKGDPAAEADRRPGTD